MRALILAATIGLFCGAAHQAEAKGCIKGAVVGGVAGHYAGHHPYVGALGGCLVGRHLAAQRAAQARAQANAPPSPDSNGGAYTPTGSGSPATQPYTGGGYQR